MSAEVTASILIGPIRKESTHGTPSGLPGGRLFAPSHVLVLMENSRATWIVQRCPELRDAAPSRRIRPASPAHLLAAAMLGYTALVKHDVIDASERLRALITREPEDRSLRIAPIDDDTAAHIYDYCSNHVYGVVTRLPESTINTNELQMAAAAGMQIATPGGDGRGT